MRSIRIVEAPGSCILNPRKRKRIYEFSINPDNPR